MRPVVLGHWHYFTWHLPALAMLVLAGALGVAVGRTLRGNAYGPRDRALRWSIVGWCAVSVAVLSGVVWPYLGAASTIDVRGDGAWTMSNYLGIPLAIVPADEMRSLRACDLGGLGVGTGAIEITRADGRVVRTVRVSRDTLERARRALGYPVALVHDEYADRVIGPHRYDRVPHAVVAVR